VARAGFVADSVHELRPSGGGVRRFNLDITGENPQRSMLVSEGFDER